MPEHAPEVRLGNLASRLEAAIDEGYRLIWLTGPRGCGKTTFARRFSDSKNIPLLQVEPVTATPEILSERAWARLAPAAADGREPGFDDFIRLFRSSHIDGAICLDELTELRRLSHFPGVDSPLERVVEVLLRRAETTIATSRFPHWLHARSESPYTAKRMLLLDFPIPSEAELAAAGVPSAADVLRLTGGLLMHVAAIATALHAGRSISVALRHLLLPGGRVETECRASLAELLHRARGYGACKAALHVLARTQPLTLSEIARELNRTPGSTRDYLRWLEEVDLIKAERKRFRYTDPLLRLWMRLYGTGSPPRPEDFEREIEAHLEASSRPEESTAPKSHEDDATVQIPSTSSAPFDFPVKTVDDFVEID